MSSFCCSVSLLVLLVVVSLYGSPVPAGIEALHKSLTDELKLGDSVIGSNPLFRSITQSVNTSCQRKEDIQLMNATLNIYMHMFSDILHHHDNTATSALLDQVSNKGQTTSDLRKLEQMMETLRTRLSKVNTDTENMMGELQKIRVDDPIHQKKALAEFLSVYTAVSLITHPNRGKATH